MPNRMIRSNEREYIIWQNRALRFYLGARLLYMNEQYSPAAFCSIQSIEALMKATLVYWDKSFNPEAANHKVASMVRSIRNKAKDGKEFKCPEYFYKDKTYQSISRYPSNGKGVYIPATFKDDLDDVFYRLVSLVPFQFNSDLINTLKGKNAKNLIILRKNNNQMKNLRKLLKVKLGKKA